MTNKIEKMEYVSYEIPLYPTDYQKNIFEEYFGASRYAYNFALNEEISAYKRGDKFIGRNEMAKIFNKHRHSVGWLLKFIEHSLRYKLNDAIYAFERWFSGDNGYPKFKSKKETNQSFHIREDRLSIFKDTIKFSTQIGEVKCGYLPNENLIGFSYHGSTRDPSLYRRYYNPIIKKIGDKYYLKISVKIEDGFDIFSKEKINLQNMSGTIGIDLGCKRTNWIVDSMGNSIILPDMSKENKKLSRLRRKQSRQLKSAMKAKSSVKSNKYVKTINEINKYEKRKVNKRKAAIYNYISHNLLPNNPNTIVMEDVNIRGWFPTKNSNIPKKSRNKIYKNILESAPNIVQKTIDYVCSRHNINVVYADKRFPSSKRCCVCGNIQNIGNSRIYKCERCGNNINRHMNAAINLSIYPIL